MAKWRWRRISVWGVLVLAVAAGIGYAFRPQPVLVDIAMVGRGPLVVTIDEEGETRVKDVFVVSAPVMGRVLRIEAEVGDVVVAGDTVVAEIEPVAPSFLDMRSRAEAEALLRAAEAARQVAAADLRRARAELDFAGIERDRAEKLLRKEWIAESAYDAAERAYDTRQAEVETAEAALEMRAHELETARARLLSPADAGDVEEPCKCVPIRAPVSGRVLRVFHESAGVVQAAEPLLEIGDPENLEIVADLLSADAVKVRPGQHVFVEEWGGGEPLAGRVRRVEPFGFTKVSALGIEEQRVNVIIDLEDPVAQRSRLGHGYRVEVRIVLWHDEDVLKVPQSALFRHGDFWSVYVAEDGRARLREVTLGHANGLEAEIIDGLAEGASLVLHPSDRIASEVRIAERD
ncbi:MAG: HlyD family efflux transporter periplasmic adaptor subunit [Alphaproteobacteria bacterium]|nr:HlyD family efflux transporter periplasmic adaptor subunit [Alphaproteobacteria bacterium]